jgi:hypothetical protein
VARRDELVLRRFLAARRDGNARLAERCWNELLALNFDRIRNMVAAYSHAHLSETERQEAIQLSIIKISRRLIHTFNGTSMGEWVEAVRTLIKFKCGDVQREAARHSRHQVPYVAGDESEAAARQRDVDEYREHERRRQLEESAEADAEQLSHDRAFLDWALEQLAPKRRAVIELDRRGIPTEQIQRQLKMSRDVVYANRSRGLKDLAKQLLLAHVRRDRITPGAALFLLSERVHSFQGVGSVHKALPSSLRRPGGVRL